MGRNQPLPARDKRASRYILNAHHDRASLNLRPKVGRGRMKKPNFEEQTPYPTTPVFDPRDGRASIGPGRAALFIVERCVSVNFSGKRTDAVSGDFFMVVLEFDRSVRDQRPVFHIDQMRQQIGKQEAR